MRSRVRAGFVALAVAAALLAPMPATAAPLVVVQLTPANGSTVFPPAEIRVRFNQCVDLPRSSLELRSPQGTLISVMVSYPDCRTIVIGPTETLGSGQFTIYAFGVTIGGDSVSHTATFYSDGIAPVPPDPAMTHPINDSNRTKVYVTGTGEPGASVFVLIDDDNGSTPAVACGVSGQPACGVVGSGGLFAVGPFNVTGLDDSPVPSTVVSTLSIEATVTLTDPAGNVSAPRYAYAYKDVVYPAAPVVDWPTAGLQNANQRWTVTGTVSPQAGFEHMDVLLYDNGVAATTARARCASGTCAWHGTIVSNPGSRTFVARARDAAGNVGPASASATVTVTSSTSTGPIRPSIDIDPYPVRDALSASGVAQAGAPLEIKIGAAPYVACATASFSPGTPNYSCGPFDTSAIAPGIFPVLVRDPSANGGTSGVNVLRDTVAPAAPMGRFSDPGPWVNAQQAPGLRLDGSAEPFASVTGSVVSTGGGTSVVFTTQADVFGHWSATTNAALLNDGCLSATIRAVDARGNTSAPSAIPCGPTLDKTAPPAPVIVVPAEGAIVTSTTFAVSGTAGGGASTVQVFEGASLKATSTAAAFTGAGIAITVFNDGTKILRARSFDPAGNPSALSAPRTIILDANAPVLSVTSPPNNGITNPSATITATYVDDDHANLGSCTLTVRDRGGALAMGVVSLSGMSCIFSAASGALTVSGSPYTATVQASDPAGNQSQVDTWQFSIDDQPPAAPAFTAPADGSLNGSPVEFRGTAEPGSTVQLFFGPTFLGASFANPTWSITASFSDGSYTVTAVAIDAAGNVSPGANRSVVIDTTPPAAPVITAPASGATVGPGTAVTGTAEAGATVRLFDGPVLLGQTVANPGWSITPSTSPEGPRTVTAFAVDPAGNTSAGTSRSYIVDTSSPGAPVITAPAEGAFLAFTNVTVTGTAEVSSTVRIYEGAALLGTQAAAPGWSFPLTFSEGTHSVRVTATDVAGNVSPDATRSFTVDTVAPGAPSILSPANGSLQPATFTLSGTAEPHATVQINEGITLVATTTATSSGTWSASITASDGLHVYTARQTDRAGNIGPASAGRTVNVDATPPGAPVISSPAEGSWQKRRVVIQGTAAEPGGLITVLENGQPIAAAQVSGTGAWEIVYDFPNDATRGIVARQTDLAGNVGPNSPLRTFTTDGTPPAITITTANLYPILPVVSAANPTFTGSAADQPGGGVMRVDVTILDVLGNVVQAAQAACSSCGPAGNPVAWTYTASSLLPGIYTIEVTATDRAGNVTAPPERRTFVTLGL
ncbi:MAG TPA: Ig-like domain-containing protein [Actinomycetota bacterium]|nr:Ig-like domain-containing protein [Actinomycetota bacterium]